MAFFFWCFNRPILQKRSIFAAYEQSKIYPTGQTQRRSPHRLQRQGPRQEELGTALPHRPLDCRTHRRHGEGFLCAIGRSPDSMSRSRSRHGRADKSAGQLYRADVGMVFRIPVRIHSVHAPLFKGEKKVVSS